MTTEAQNVKFRRQLAKLEASKRTPRAFNEWRRLRKAERQCAAKEAHDDEIQRDMD